VAKSVTRKQYLSKKIDRFLFISVGYTITLNLVWKMLSTGVNTKEAGGKP